MGGCRGMRDIKIIFEVNNGDIKLDIKTEMPEDFVAGIGYMVEQASKSTGLSIPTFIDAIQYAATLKGANVR
jgi:hypothetical protein